MAYGRNSRLVAVAAAALAAAPAASAQAAKPPALGCADAPRLEAERLEVKSEIAGIAMSGSDRRQRHREVGAGKMAAGAATGLLLPFGIGLALKGTMMLAEHVDKQAKAKRPQPPAPPEPDVAAMIERQHQLDLQLAALAEKGCPAPVAATAKSG
jgi:hypothetical protein